jgi:myo-inositol-1(or 4)-monophosphatase
MLDPSIPLRINLDRALDVAIRAAHAAGNVLQRHFRKKHTIQTKRSPRDLVTEVDREAQEMIVKIINQKFPDHRFLTEEIGTEKMGDTKSPYVWVIDPLDGTTNFVHGKPLCGTNIALQENSHTIMGVMWNPFSKDLFTAKRGSGALWNTKPIILRKTRDILDALLSTNITERSVMCHGVRHVAIPLSGGIHNYGCAMEEIAAILRGENDGVFFDGVGLWDIAAGCLMIEEVGGRSRIEFHDPSDPRKGVRCVASTTPIFEELCTFLLTRD